VTTTPAYWAHLKVTKSENGPTILSYKTFFMLRYFYMGIKGFKMLAILLALFALKMIMNSLNILRRLCQY
jgi:hypothetical protein